MEIFDMNGKIIVKGITVMYKRTGTTGKVEKICIKNDAIWIKLDSTGLYYKKDYLEVFEHEIKRNHDSREIKIDQKIAKLENLKSVTATEISNHTDGPGYGGG